MTEAGLIWSRIEAAHGRHHLDQSLTDAEYEINSWKLDAGVDGQFYENARGRLIGSVWVNYGPPPPTSPPITAMAAWRWAAPGWEQH